MPWLDGVREVCWVISDLTTVPVPERLKALHEDVTQGLHFNLRVKMNWAGADDEDEVRDEEDDDGHGDEVMKE